MDRNQLACVAEQNSVKSVNLKHQNGNLKNRILAEDPKNIMPVGGPLSTSNTGHDKMQYFFS